MSGTIFSLGLSQRVKSTGKPESGWKLYLYQANTSIAVTAYKDDGLTVGQEHPWPIVADASGMMPAFWLADGSYRARGTSSNGGSIFFDLGSVLALGASSGGGGGGDTTDPNSIFSTGMPIWMPTTGLKSGWVRMNARTIGSATSGATERANADTQTLFEYIYANYSDALCAVVGGRGASVAADWAANKQITLLDMRSRGAFGVPDMGNVDSTAFDAITFLSGNKTTGGSALGAATKEILQANLPSVTLATTIAAGQGSHSHTWSPAALANVAGPLGTGSGTYGSVASTAAATLPAMSGTTPLGGSGTAIDKMSPGILGTWYWRL